MSERESKYKVLGGTFLLLIAAIIWGSAFVAQSTAMDHIGPFTMNGLRSLFAALFLFPTMYASDKVRGKKPTFFGTTNPSEIKTLLKGGILMGVLVTIASTMQQIGIISTTVGKAGFLTTLYIVIVPILGLFLKKKIGLSSWIAIILSLIGMYLLCITGSFSIGIGDLLMIGSAFFFAVHILVIDAFSYRVSGLRLSFIQFVVCSFVCLVFALIYERPEVEDIMSAMGSIIWVGVFSAGIGYTLQILGQKYVPTHVAPLIMSLESVFSVISGAIFLNEVMNNRESIGCILIFCGVILAQIPFNKILKKRKKRKKGQKLKTSKIKSRG